MQKRNVGFIRHKGTKKRRGNTGYEGIFMKSMVDIEVILDAQYTDPKVKILTKNRNGQVESIIEAIENVSGNDFPLISGNDGDTIELLSQRDIVRVYIQGRKVMVQTDEKTYTVSRTLTNLSEILNPERFLRISQSEIINLYKVKCFDINVAGTIGIEFENGVKSWASRSGARAIRDMLKKTMN